MASRFGVLSISMTVLFLASAMLGESGDTMTKTTSVLYPASRTRQARSNIERYDWAKEARDTIVDQARPWRDMSDDDLWSLMFGNTIRRSWMVWSDGHCPSCKEGVPMYNWKMDALKEPWKVRCPHCSEAFPKNDFHKFYLSGLDEQGVFDPAKADRSLFFNSEHPDPEDPRHRFGVDDGDGYVDGGKRWRFIGAYLVYGQWKQAVVGGIKKLAAAYVVTGDPVYARKAGILLDRVADLYPTFDFAREGLVYERGGNNGYVSTWHDACEETREMAIAYDQVFEALKTDEEFVGFLALKATEFGLENPKTTFADVQRNIEERILRDALRNQHKIFSNYPRKDIAVAVIKTVLDWPANRSEVEGLVDAMIKRSTSVDGVTGEKGLPGYAAYVIRAMATFLGDLDRVDPAFLEKTFERYPALHETYRFHIDTWCMQTYYPLIGDAWYFAAQIPLYQGVLFVHPWKPDKHRYRISDLRSSPYTFLWKLYEHTGDTAFAQVMVHANGGSVEGIPHDLFIDDPERVQDELQSVIEREGTEINLGSINKEEWHVAILRGGEGRDARAAWLHYGVEGNHRHWDGMNLGLFAKGLDLMPDFGYPPVQFGGWNSPRADWYRNTVSHNTVVVDGRNHADGAGTTTLWAEGELLSAIRVSCPQMIGGKRFERTVAMVNISDSDAYLLDVFRVEGGQTHEKYMCSHFGTIETAGLTLDPAPDHKPGGEMRDFRRDPTPDPGWSITWTIKDEHGYLPAGTPVHLRYTDLTTDAEAYTCEAWIVNGTYESGKEVWIPRIKTRRSHPEADLASTFVAVIEPYGKTSNIKAIRRLPVVSSDGKDLPDSFVAVELELDGGTRDLLLSSGAEPGSSAPVLEVPEWDLETDAELCVVRKDKDGNVIRAMVSKGSFVRSGEWREEKKEAGTWEFSR